MAASIKSPPSVTGHTDLDQLRRPSTGGIEGEKARLRKATREFESFFMYQMLKTMRKTVPESSFAENAPMSGSMGKDMFTDMFDMEIARKGKFSGKNSISELLYRSLEKLIDARYTTELDQDSQPVFRPLKSNGAKPQQLREAIPVELPEGGPTMAPIEQRDEALPLPRMVSPRKVTELPEPSVAEKAPSVQLVPVDHIVKKYGKLIDEAAAESELDSALIASVIKVESNGDPRAVSRAGAKGLMQLVDSTASDMKVRDVYDPKDNIRAGSRYLRRMLDRFGSLEMALAAYNAGPGNVEKFGGIPPFEETRAYVKRVTDQVRERSAVNSHGSTKGVQK